ncbi:uncharacterized protein [Mytilus edulis]|uniref:uncharacterized protein n=1 Tax=Mytilus edulis TaxID=6550 RepID=UPI0039F0FC29
MPSCQSINCTNTKGRCDKSFFEIPDPKKSAEKRKQCKLWIDHLRNDKLNMDTFQWSKSRVVCQDHFEQNCFDRNLMAESLGFKGTLKLKPGSVPTIVKPGPGVRHEKQDRHSTHQLIEKRKKAQLRDSIVAFIGEKNDVGSKMSGVKRKSMVEHRHCAPKKDKPSTVEHQEQKQDFSSIDTIEVPSESIVCVPQILSCGHPCETCIRYKGNESFNMLTVKDHSYSKSKDNTLNASHEEGNSILQPHTSTFNFILSTPTKQDFVEAYSKRDTCTADKNDDSNDKDYVIDSEESECDSVEQDLVILTPEQ